MDPRARRPRRSRLGLALLLLLLAAAALEGGVRARQWLRYGTAAGSLYAFELDPASGLRVPAPGVHEGARVRIEVDSAGFRSPELERPKPPGRLRLAFLGGSTTFCAEVSGNEATWPHLVAQGLAERFPAVGIDYVNASAGGLAVEHSLVNLRHRVAPTEPDVVVIYHATNDLAQGTRELALEAGLVAEDDREESLLGRWSLAWRLLAKNLAGPEPPGAGRHLDPDPTRHAARFADRLTELVAACREEGAVPVLVTFAHKARREQPPEVRAANCASSLYYMPYMTVDGILAGIEAYNDVIRAVAREQGCVLVEGEHSIPGDERHFADSVHFLDAGCVLQARRVVEALAASPRFAQLVRERAP